MALCCATPPAGPGRSGSRHAAHRQDEAHDQPADRALPRAALRARSAAGSAEPSTFADAMLHPAAALARAMGGISLSCAAPRKPSRLPSGVGRRDASGGRGRVGETTRRISVTLTVEEALPNFGGGGGDDSSSVATLAPRRRMVSLVTSDETPSPSGRTLRGGGRPRTVSWNVSEDARGERTVSMSVVPERGSWPCAPRLQSCVRAVVGCAC